MASALRMKVVNLALTQVGVVGGKASGDDKYIEYYNRICGTKLDVDTTAWCAIFVTWCLRNAGISTSICPSFAGCTSFRDSYMIPKKIWKLRTSGYIPRSGDLIFFNWNKQTNKLQHVGIVEKVVDNTIYTIEGNSKGSYTTYGVRHKSYLKTSRCIVGYGALPYEGSSSTSTTVGTVDFESRIKMFQSWMNKIYSAGLAIDGSFGPASKRAAIRILQRNINTTRSNKIDVDGSFGPKTKAAVDDFRTYSRGSSGHMIYLAQGMLYANKINPKGFDGLFGPGLQSAVKLYQIKKGLSATGIIDQNFWNTMFT